MRFRWASGRRVRPALRMPEMHPSLHDHLQLNDLHWIDRPMLTYQQSARDGIESRESIAARESVAACVRRLIEIGLPEAVALHARDAVRATVDNFVVRKMQGEFEPR